MQFRLLIAQVTEIKGSLRRAGTFRYGGSPIYFTFDRVDQFFGQRVRAGGKSADCGISIVS